MRCPTRASRSSAAALAPTPDKSPGRETHRRGPRSGTPPARPRARTRRTEPSHRRRSLPLPAPAHRSASTQPSPVCPPWGRRYTGALKRARFTRYRASARASRAALRVRGTPEAVAERPTDHLAREQVDDGHEEEEAADHAGHLPDALAAG